MRVLVFVCSLLAALFLAALSLPSHAQDAAQLIARQNDDWVRLQQLPCTELNVLAHLDAADVENYGAATSFVGGAPYAACWKIYDESYVYLMYEDGDNGVIPITNFSVYEPDAEEKPGI